MTTATTFRFLASNSLNPFKKQAFSRTVLFLSVILLSMVTIDNIFFVSYSINVYEQNCAQWPGLSILPSPSEVNKLLSIWSFHLIQQCNIQKCFIPFFFYFPIYNLLYFRSTYINSMYDMFIFNNFSQKGIDHITDK